MQVRRVIVIGAGMGGLAAAIWLAAKGIQVTVFERASSPGGKIRTVALNDISVDTGPTVFTMRWVFDELFQQAATSLEDHLQLTQATVLARHAWNSQERLDLFADVNESADAIGCFSGAQEANRFLVFAAEARRIYNTLKGPFICSQRPSPFGLVRRAGLSGLGDLLHIKPFETMWGALGRHFSDQRLRQLFGRYATYCGSSPFRAPATLMLVAHVEQDGVWMIEGGMHRLPAALAAMAERLGANLHYDSQVASIETRHSRVSGVRLLTGETFPADAIVFNGDCNALATGLLGESCKRAVPCTPHSMRSLSAITWAMLARTDGFPLTRHNVFFSSNYPSEFAQLDSKTPEEPTVYVCAQDREGLVDKEERLLCLVNAPALGDTSNEPPPELEQSMRRKLHQCGLEIDWQPENCVVTTPNKLARLFPATGGAIYGRASHGWMASFQRPASATKLPGLYLAGGSIHPGPGIPMAALSGRLAAESILSSRNLM